MITDLEASNLTDSTVQYVKGYDAYSNGETDTFEGLHLIDDKTFSVTIDAQYMPYYYGQALISNQPESMDLWLPEDVTLEDTENGVKFSDNFTSEYIGDKVQAARYDYNICSGPYMFTSYDENSYAYTLTKNPNFPGNFEGQTANIETVIVKYTPQDTMMDQLKNYYKEMGVDEKVFDYAQEVEKGLKDRFETLDAIAQLNQIKVLNAMQKHQIAEMHLGGTTGYGYNDSGREAVEALYADVFGTEDALVRPQITCGTHALGLALSANLRPGDEILAISGKPYDTLEEVIGIRESKGSLKEYGITYAQVDLLEDFFM